MHTFREATLADIPQLKAVRLSVKENMLSDPLLVTDEDYRVFLAERGKGWLCETTDGRVAGFAVADLQEDNIWALFLLPEYEGQGIARRLHDIMLDWYFSMGKEQVWLSTAAGTRAEQFYRKAGWRATGLYGKGEIKFEMSRAAWIARQ